MKLRLPLLFLILVTFTASLQAQDWKTYPYTPAGSEISFPTDEGRHTDQPVESWYTVGHLTGETTGKKYSYMLTYFYYPTSTTIGTFDGFRIMNISDDDTGTFYDDTNVVNYISLATDKIDIDAAPALVAGTHIWRNKVDGSANLIPFEYEIVANTNSTALDLEYVADKEPLIVGGDGFFNVGASASIYFYSHTSLAVTGSITVDGFTENVTGTAWIDHQYGNFDPTSSENYEKFNLQLSNGMDLNLYNIFDGDNNIPESIEYSIMSGYVDENTQFTTNDFVLERLAFECVNDDDGIEKCYSQKWQLTSPVNAINLTIETVHSNTEVDLPFRFYEGATTVTGTIDGVNVTGMGFAELIHSYDDPVLTITNPADGTWNFSQDITWQLDNPDEGRPVMYDLAYSTDNITYNVIATGLSETSYNWENPSVELGSDIWFKVTAYSIDNTLMGEVTSAPAQVLSVDLASRKQFSVFPNPARTQITIAFDEIPERISYEIVMLNGQVVLKDTPSLQNGSLTVDLNDLSSGIYLLKVSSNSGQSVSKIIKQ